MHHLIPSLLDSKLTRMFPVSSVFHACNTILSRYGGAGKVEGELAFDEATSASRMADEEGFAPTSVHYTFTKRVSAVIGFVQEKIPANICLR